MAIVKLGDIAIEAKSSNKGDKTGIRIVGLEHLTPLNITLLSWSEDTKNTFTKEFSKGDVLFGRRRAYLKKAAVAPFDGICSGDITVIRAIEDKVDPDLLPFIIQNDFLFDFAVGKSAGSLSPRVKWTHLKEFAIELPSMPEQSKLAETLWSINETKNAYEELINKTDELVKSQFIEMFQNEFKTCLKLKMNKAFNLQMGKTPARADSSLWQSKDQKWVSIADMSTYEKYTEDTKEYISDYAIDKIGMKIVPANTVIMSFKLTIGRTAITSEDIYTNEAIMAFIQKSDLFEVDYLRWALHFTDWLSGVQNAVKGATLNKFIIGNMEIPIPSKALQNKFLGFAEQSDKSKFALQEAIKDLDTLSKKIIAENLIPVGKE